jgi:hypothetical protein
MRALGKSPDVEHVYAITPFNPGSESENRQHHAESRRVKFDGLTPAWGAILSHQKTGVQEGVCLAGRSYERPALL